MQLTLPILILADLGLLLKVVYAVLVLVTIGVIIHDKREPVKALAWITVIALIPVAGMVLYVVFGRNHRKEKIFNRKEIRDLEQIEKLCAQQLKDIADPDLMLRRSIADNRDIITLLLNNNKSLLTVHNRVKVLNNGKATFAAILEALRGATSSIHLEYYIFENDRIGKRVARILIEKARAGVAVRLI